MSVKLVPFICPSCGGHIQVPEGARTCYCMYCGTQIAIDDGSIHLHTYDEAELKRIELEKQDHVEERAEFERYLARRRKWVIALVIWFVLLATAMVVTAVIGEGAAHEVASVIGGSILLFGPIILVIARPRRYRRKRGY